MKKWPWFVLALAIVFIDQASKYWALQALDPYQPEAVFPLFNLTLS